MVLDGDGGRIVSDFDACSFLPRLTPLFNYIATSESLVDWIRHT